MTIRFDPLVMRRASRVDVSPSRADVVALAERYADHPWTPRAENIIHRRDAAGVLSVSRSVVHRARLSQKPLESAS